LGVPYMTITAERLAELTAGLAEALTLPMPDGQMGVFRHADDVVSALRELAEKRKRLRNILRDDTPWPLQSVLVQLIRAAEHLMKDHNCDLHGHELLRESLRVANEILLSLIQSAAIRPLKEAQK